MEEARQLPVLSEFTLPHMTMLRYEAIRDLLHPPDPRTKAIKQAARKICAEWCHDLKPRSQPVPKDWPYIYFIQVGASGPIKVGLSVNPERRLRQLQTAQAEELRFVLVYPGGRDDERSLHKLLDRICLGGEWFYYCEWLSEFISKLRRRLYGAYGESCLS